MSVEPYADAQGGTPVKTDDEKKVADMKEDGDEKGSDPDGVDAPTSTGTAQAEDQDSWKEQLSEHDRKAFQQELSDLRKHAEHEYKYASLDGCKELDEMKAEYAGKEARLVAAFKKKAKAAEAAAAHSSQAQQKDAHASPDQPPAPMFLLATGDGSNSKGDDSAEGGDTKPGSTSPEDSGKKEDKNSAKDDDEKKAGDEKGTHAHGDDAPSDSWKEQLSEHDSKAFQQELSDLRKHAEHEYKYASLDGRKELDERKAEYAGKEARLVAAFKKKAAAAEAAAAHSSQAEHKDAHASSEQPPAPMILLATGDGSNSKGSNESSNAHGTDLQESKGAAHAEEVHAKDTNTEGTASKQQVSDADGARMASKGKDAVEKKSADQTNASQMDPKGHASEEDWKQQLTAEQRHNLRSRLAHLHKESRVQMKYASEYGKQAEEHQQEDYEHRVDKVVAKFKQAVSRADSASPGGLATLSAPGSVSPTVAGFAFGLPIFLVAAFAIKRRGLAQTSLRQPLLLVE